MTNKLLFILFISAFSFFNSFAQQGSLDPTFNPGDIGFGAGDGANLLISATAIQPDGKIIIGGNFTSYNSSSINRIIRLNPNGTKDTSFKVGTGANNTVSAIAVQPDGKILISGTLSQYNGTSINRLTRLNPNGSIDTSFHPGTGASSTINSFAVQTDGKIIIAGAFTSYNGTSINRIARLTSSGAIDATFTPGTAAANTVNKALLQSDGKIIIVGNFTTYNGTSSKYIARLNTDGTLDGTFTVGTGASALINTAALQSDGKIIIAGSFTSYNGTNISKIAKLNSDGTLDATFNPGTSVNNTVNSIAIEQDGKIVIAGIFSTFNGVSSSRIARISSTGTYDANFNIGVGVNNTVSNSIITSDGKILITGDFTQINGVALNRIAKFNTDGSIDPNFNPTTGAAVRVKTISFPTSNRILIGGYFTMYNSQIIKYLACLKLDGSVDTSFHTGSGVNLPVDASLVQPDGKIIISGYFTSYNGTSINRIARLNADGTLDASFTPGTGADGRISALALQSDGKIIIGGAFTDYNGTARSNIARLNADGTLDATFDPGAGADNPVNTISIQSDGLIIIGGEFTYYNSVYKSYIARLNSDGSLDGTFTNYADGIVFSSAIGADGKIYIGGAFTNYNGSTVGRLVRLTTAGSLDGTFNTSTGASSTVFSIITLSNGEIYISGYFSTYNGTSRNRIARLMYNGNLDATFDPGTAANGTIICMNIMADQRLMIGGEFTSYNGIGRNRVARLYRVCNSYISAVTSTTNQICPGTSVELTAQGLIIGANAILTWYDGPNGTGNNLGTSNPITVTPTATTTYYARLAGSCNIVQASRIIIVWPSYSINNPQAICPGGSYTINGHTYNSAGTYYDTYHTTLHGCDSTIVTELAVYPVYSVNNPQSICMGGSYSINGHTYTHSGTYYDTFQSVNGCDSTVVTQITVNPMYSINNHQYICHGSSYNINGHSYTSSGVYFDTFTSRYGCDSTINTILTVYPTYHQTESHNMCLGDSYLWHGTTYTSGGVINDNHTTVHGCDSIFTLNLTVNPTYSFIEYDTIYNNETLVWHGTSYNSAGDYTKHYNSTAGCDSMYTLHLTHINTSNQFCSWLYINKIIVNNSANPSTLTDYSVLIKLNTAALIAAGKMKTDGSDIRFTMNNFSNLSYWIDPGIQNEHGINRDSTYIWVKVPFIPGGSSTSINMYYGNPSATALSDIGTTFLFGDDFNDNSLDNSKWEVIYDNLGHLAEQNQRLEHNSPRTTPQSNSHLYSKQQFSGTIALEFQFKKGGYIYRGAGLNKFNSNNSAMAYWQDWGPFGANSTVNGVASGIQFRTDSWSNTYNPEYYVKIVHNADSTFSYYEKVPSVEPGGPQSWYAKINDKKLPLDSTLKFYAYDGVWGVSSLPRYEDNIRVRKYSSPEPTTQLSNEQPVKTLIITNASVCDGGVYHWLGNDYYSAVVDSVTFQGSLGCDSIQKLILIINPDYSINNPQSICQGGSYSINSHNYTTANTYYDTFQSKYGCDSIVVTQLTVNPSYSINNPQSICQGGSYSINGHTYTTADTYYDTFQSKYGCDSIVVTQLTVNPTYSINNPQSICQGGSYSINGHTYTTADTYYDTFHSKYGCDSIVATQLTVNPTYSINNPQSICQGGSYSINGHTYTIADTYYDTFQSKYGCDSIIATQLTVNPTYSINNPQSICQGGSYSINGHTYTIADTYYDTFQSKNGCDSIVATQLTVNPTYSINNPQSICQGGSYSINGHTYTIADTYYDTFQSKYGCDSIIATQLTVNILPGVDYNEVNNFICLPHNPFAPSGINPVGGTFTGTGVSLNTFSPDIVGPGIYIITYSYTDGNQCTNSDTSRIVVDLCTSVYDFSGETALFVYPNPSSGKFFIDYGTIEKAVVMKISIVNSLGQVILQTDFPKTEIDLSSEPEGIYIIQFKTALGLINKKLIID